MTRPELERIGQRWADALNKDQPPLGANVRQRFLATVAGGARPEARARRQQVLAVGAALAVIATIVALAAWPLARSPVTFTVAGRPAQPGEWLSTKRDNTIPIQFEDGSKLVLRGSTRARVAETSADGARLALHTGVVQADVVPREGGSWQVTAGPFDVYVVGTEFRVAWDPVGEVFELSVTEGSVQVDGPLLGSRRPLAAGQRCRVSLAASRFEISSEASSAASETTLAEDSKHASSRRSSSPAKLRAPTSEEPTQAHRDSPPSATPTGQAVAPDVQQRNLAAPEQGHQARRAEPPTTPVAQGASEWTQRESEGRYLEAIQAAQRVGLERLYRKASAEQLLSLARAARHTGRINIERTSLISLRRRFAGSSQAALSAYLLGALAADRAGAPGEAAKWFSLYLSENPSGQLAREAQGRLMEAEQRRGQIEAARRTAANYLKRYPNGPHATLAREVLERR